jgi:hypothetical protein
MRERGLPAEVSQSSRSPPTTSSPVSGGGLRRSSTNYTLSTLPARPRYRRRNSETDILEEMENEVDDVVFDVLHAAPPTGDGVGDSPTTGDSGDASPPLGAAAAAAAAAVEASAEEKRSPRGLMTVPVMFSKEVRASAIFADKAAESAALPSRAAHPPVRGGMLRVHTACHNAHGARSQVPFT